MRHFNVTQECVKLKNAMTTGIVIMANYITEKQG